MPKSKPMKKKVSATKKAVLITAKAEEQEKSVEKSVESTTVESVIEESTKESATKDIPKASLVSSSKEIRKAHPAGHLPSMSTAIAKVTSVKFVGGWRKLEKGKPITAEKEVIENLRQSGLVE